MLVLPVNPCTFILFQLQFSSYDISIPCCNSFSFETHLICAMLVQATFSISSSSAALLIAPAPSCTRCCLLLLGTDPSFQQHTPISQKSTVMMSTYTQLLTTTHKARIITLCNRFELVVKISDIMCFLLFETTFFGGVSNKT